MQELRLVAVSEDGAYLVLASAGRGTRFMLPVDDRLRAAVRGQFSRLGHYEIEVENPLRPKEIQARIRSGETAEAIAEISGIPIERVRWFEGPVLQERQYMAQQAQQAAVRRQGESSPGQNLGELVAERVGNPAPDNGELSWDSWKMTDSTWRVRLTFHEQGHERIAHWSYDPRRRSVAPLDDEATRFSTPDAAGPPGTDDGDNIALFTRRRSVADAFSPTTTAPRFEPTPAPPPPPPPPAPEPEPARPEPPAPAPEPAAERRPDTGVPTPPAAPEPAPRPPQRPEPPRPPARQAPPAPPFPTDAPSILTPPTPPGRPAPEAPPTPPPAPDPAPPAESPAASGAPARPARPKREPITASTAGNPGNQPAKPARGGKRSRRASVPSWDEIMFGSRKQD